MSAFQHAVGYLATVLEIGLLFALVARGHIRVAPIFALYLTGICLTQAPIFLWPERFFNRSFWLLHVVIEATFRFALALELAHGIFRRFPGAASTAMNAVLTVVTLTAVTV